MMNLTKEMLRGEDIDMSYFSRRRTIRNFHPEPLDDELLTTIVRQATKAPTTGNMQLYSVICTRMPERKQKLAELHFCQPATNAPVLLTIVPIFIALNAGAESAARLRASTICRDFSTAFSTLLF